MSAREATQRADQGHQRSHRQIGGGATIELSTRSLCSSPRQPIAVIRSSIEDCDHEMRRSLEEFQPLRQPGAPSDEAPKTNPTDRLPKVSYGRNKSALRPRSHPNFVWRDWSQFSRNLAAPRVRFLDRPTEGRLPSRDRAAHGCAVSPRQQKRPR